MFVVNVFGDALEAPNRIKKAQSQSGNLPINSRYPPIAHKEWDIEAPSSARRDPPVTLLSVL